MKHQDAVPEAGWKILKEMLGTTYRKRWEIAPAAGLSVSQANTEFEALEQVGLVERVPGRQGEPEYIISARGMSALARCA